MSLFSQEDLVGRKVEIFWPLDQMLYSGKILKFLPETGKHEVRAAAAPGGPVP